MAGRHWPYIGVLSDGGEARMTEVWRKDGVWLLYDGECPMCTSAAHAIRLQEEFGSLHLLDARTATDHPLFQLSTEMGLDLDDGMVIAANGMLYHGDAALIFLSRFGDSGHLKTSLFKILFRFDWMARLGYPWLRSIRNHLLRGKSVGRIDNLMRRREPLFKSIFGEAWDHLPPVFKSHYANRPYTNDRTRVIGVMDVACFGPLKVLAPLMNAMGQIPARNQKDVSVAVEYTSDFYSRSFTFRRMFAFADDEPYTFGSRMVQTQNNEVVEIMRFGLCWRLRFSWDGVRVTLSHRGYAFNLFGLFVPLPLTWLLGRGHAEETAVNDRTFDMATHITHPLWGRVYEYKGRFRIIEEPE
jgi:predicted DCC family thiol-disulfide oxidoreductase YuxK